MRQLIVSAILLLTDSVVRADDHAYAEALKNAGNNVKLEKDGRLAAITFSKSETLTDDDYKKLGSLENLKQLTFYGNCKMTDSQSVHVGRLGTIEQMAINYKGPEALKKHGISYWNSKCWTNVMYSAGILD